MKKHWTYFLVGLGFASVLWIYGLRMGKPDISNNIAMPDTVFIDKPYKEIVIRKVEVPKRVLVYERDTFFRERIEKDTLITGLEITPSLAQIHTITPKGIPIIQEYPLPEYHELKIDHQGKLQVKKKRHKKFWKRVGQVGIFVGGAFIGSSLNGLIMLD